MKSIFTYAAHLIVSAFGILIVLDTLISRVAEAIPQYLGVQISRAQLAWLFIDNPYAPIQLLGGLFLGYIFQQALGHREMLWVWILPFVWLCAGFCLFPALAIPPRRIFPVDSSLGTRLAVFFGEACQSKLGCADRFAFTLPFYGTVSYSLGALVAWRDDAVHGDDSEPRESCDRE